jgi:hypothetical protein
MSADRDDPCRQDFAENTRRLFVDIAQARAIASGARPARRAVFRKTHGVVRAKMSLDPDRPASIRFGIFAADKYDVWIRFSSDVAPTEGDSGNGTVGIAMKLFGVSPPTLAEVDPDAPTADLLLQNHDVFFVDTGYDMCAFTQLSLDGREDEWYAQHPETKAILAAMAKREESVLTATYWSVLPYACGNGQAVKYRLSPESEGPSMAPDGDPNRLRSDLAARLFQQESGFRLSIQIPRPGTNLPTDQATVRWPETAAPFTPVAKVAIPAQNIHAEGQETYGDALAFSPWRMPEANRPLGSIAESRRKAYPSSAAQRHCVNGQINGEPHASRRS